eukprot:scaffold55087_cov18-Prasinocladus_malaysianus.AAC.2
MNGLNTDFRQYVVYYAFAQFNSQSVIDALQSPIISTASKRDIKFNESTYMSTTISNLKTVGGFGYVSGPRETAGESGTDLRARRPQAGGCRCRRQRCRP